MANLISTAQSQEVINVSQDCMTPSSKDSENPTGLAKADHFIPDSLEQPDQLDTTQAPPSIAHDDCDDLYTLSPKAQLEHDARRNPAQQSKALKDAEQPIVETCTSPDFLREESRSQSVLVEDSCPNKVDQTSLSCFASPKGKFLFDFTLPKPPVMVVLTRF